PPTSRLPYTPLFRSPAALARKPGPCDEGAPRRVQESPPMRKLRAWLIGILLLAVIGGGFYGWWALDLRWRPHTIKTHQAGIAKRSEEHTSELQSLRH